MKIKYKITFKLRSFGRKTIRHQIRMRFSFNAQRTDIATGWNLDSPQAWNEEKEKVTEGYAGSRGETAADINADLQKMKEHLDMAFRYFEANDIIPTPSQVVMRYEERINGIAPKRPEPEKKDAKPKESDFFEVYEMFLAECGEKNAWTPATFEKMHAMREDYKTFRPHLKFSDLTEKALTEFVTYLREQKVLKTPRKKKDEREEDDRDAVTGLKNSTIKKKLGYMRWFLNWATDRGFNTNTAYKHFEPTLKQTQKKVIYLTRDEMKSILAANLTGENLYLEPVRDIFMFCCFSSLRYSDAASLHWNDVRDDHIEVTTIKTADSISIEINDMMRSILDKYREIPSKNGLVFPFYTNQAMNRDLKELCKLSGIDQEERITTYKGNERIDEIKHKWELIGTHTGRRTFIVNALSRGISPTIVMKWTGHASYSSMKPYIDIVDSIKATEMAKMNFMDE